MKARAQRLNNQLIVSSILSDVAVEERVESEIEDPSHALVAPSLSREGPRVTPMICPHWPTQSPQAEATQKIVHGYS